MDARHSSFLLSWTGISLDRLYHIVLLVQSSFSETESEKQLGDVLEQRIPSLSEVHRPTTPARLTQYSLS